MIPPEVLYQSALTDMDKQNYATAVTALEQLSRQHPYSEYNERALRLYESLGFKQEGRMERRFRGPEGRYEADVPMAWLRS